MDSKTDVNSLFLSSLDSRWRMPEDGSRRKEWNPRKNRTRSERRHHSKNRKRKAFRLLVQRSVDFFKEKLSETSFSRKILPVPKRSA
jgi:hypothetical protein